MKNAVMFSWCSYSFCGKLRHSMGGNWKTRLSQESCQTTGSSTGCDLCRMTRHKLGKIAGRRGGRILADHLDICLQRFGATLPIHDPNDDHTKTDDDEDSDDDDDSKVLLQSFIDWFLFQVYL
ncbi:uncharacterized protein [Macrobrachium rosenbergii]|uniref:uncharacterized protein n=1 Tax=Macrobrachium rosenbergii TaxID=79674 RepID=UPI0034D40123